VQENALVEGGIIITVEGIFTLVMPFIVYERCFVHPINTQITVSFYLLSVDELLISGQRHRIRHKLHLNKVFVDSARTATTVL
jgi:hypothetical protein